MWFARGGDDWRDHQPILIFVATHQDLASLRGFAKQLKQDMALSCPSPDGVALLQEHLEAHDRAIYRVWFLAGKVQCGVKMVRPLPPSTNADESSFTGGCVGGVCALPSKSKRRLPVDPAGVPLPKDTVVAGTSDRANVTHSTPPSASEFTGGCVGGVCARPLKRKASAGAPDAAAGLSYQAQPESLPGHPAVAAAPKPVFCAWAVPEDIAQDVEDAVKISQADCGSVEFMYNESGGRPVYFDLNMLSTLPIMDGSVGDPDKVWPDAFDPWAQLADHIISRASTR